MPSLSPAFQVSYDTQNASVNDARSKKYKVSTYGQEKRYASMHAYMQKQLHVVERVREIKHRSRKNKQKKEARCETRERKGKVC